MSRPGRLLAAALVLAAAAWVVATPAPLDAQERRVVVVGDSIILGAEAPMVAGFTQRQWGVTFDAAVSRSTAAAIGAIESHRAELTDSLVLSFGANDAGNPATFRQRVDAVLDATAGVPHVYWLTIREVRDYYGPANQVLRDAAAGRPNVTIIDWHAATAGSSGLTAGDGLHLTGPGAAVMAELVATTVVSGQVPAPAPPAAPVPEPTVAEGPTTIAPAPAPPPTEAPVVAAPTTAVDPTTPTTSPATVAPDDAPSGQLARDAEEVARASTVDYGDAIGWTLGGGIAVVVGLLALAGLVLGVWSLAGARGPAAPVPRAPNHPAVRSSLRAERIAAARVAEDAQQS